MHVYEETFKTRFPESDPTFFRSDNLDIDDHVLDIDESCSIQIGIGSRYYAFGAWNEDETEFKLSKYRNSFEQAMDDYQEYLDGK